MDLLGLMGSQQIRMWLLKDLELARENLWEQAELIIGDAFY